MTFFKRPCKTYGGAPSPNGFPDDAARLATLMRNDPNVQLAFMTLGGWVPMPIKGLATLAQRLGPLFDDTAIVVMSEFVRTVRQNGNDGTDHGHGNAMWLLGGPVAGGKVYGDWRGLGDGQLHDGRDLPVTTDFRLVLAQIVERHLRLPDKQLQQLFPAMSERTGPFHMSCKTANGVCFPALGNDYSSA